jgi:hypothetical protein
MQPTPAPVIGSMPAGFSSTHTMTARIQLTSAGVGNLLPQAFGAPNLRDLRSFPGGVHVPFRGSITVREMVRPECQDALRCVFCRVILLCCCQCGADDTVD